MVFVLGSGISFLSAKLSTPFSEKTNLSSLLLLVLILLFYMVRSDFIALHICSLPALPVSAVKAMNPSLLFIDGLLADTISDSRPERRGNGEHDCRLSGVRTRQTFNSSTENTRTPGVRSRAEVVLFPKESSGSILHFIEQTLPGKLQTSSRH